MVYVPLHDDDNVIKWHKPSVHTVFMRNLRSTDGLRKRAACLYERISSLIESEKAICFVSLLGGVQWDCEVRVVLMLFF